MNRTRITFTEATKVTAVAAAAMLFALQSATADSDPQNDNLNATLWSQNSTEFKATALAAFSLAKIRLDEALADSNWTAAPQEQTGNYQDLPPAVVLDVDETLLDNSPYQAWMVLNDQYFGSKTWGEFVNTKTSRAIPGAVDFAKYADQKGVKVFYVTNRNTELEPATRENMEALGFPMGGNVDTFLMKKEQDDWGSKKGSRRAVVTKDYRVLLLIGDNLGDFVDGYKQGRPDRQQFIESDAGNWGTKWIMVANPTYGSWEAASYEFNYKLTPEEKRAMKRGELEAWAP